MGNGGGRWRRLMAGGGRWRPVDGGRWPVEAQSYASPVNSTPSFLKVVRVWFVSARMVRKRSKAENPHLRPEFSI